MGFITGVHATAEFFCVEMADFLLGLSEQGVKHVCRCTFCEKCVNGMFVIVRLLVQTMVKTTVMVFIPQIKQTVMAANADRDKLSGQSTKG